MVKRREENSRHHIPICSGMGGATIRAKGREDKDSRMQGQGHGGYTLMNKTSTSTNNYCSHKVA
jgi:hypothetical protein